MTYRKTFLNLALLVVGLAATSGQTVKADCGNNECAYFQYQSPLTFRCCRGLTSSCDVFTYRNGYCLQPMGGVMKQYTWYATYAFRSCNNEPKNGACE